MAEILIDEEELQKAHNDFLELAQKAQSLLRDIEQLNEEMRTGFDTPAGHKFYNSYKDCLCEPLNQQIIVIEHIAENLTTAKNMYQSVFDQYRSVVNMLSTSD